MGVDRARLRHALRRAAKVCLDSAVLIYHLEGTEPYADLTEEIIARIADGRLTALISTVTVTELLVKPFAEGRPDRLAECETFLHSFPNLEIVPMTEAVAKEAARLRGQHRLRTPDALIAATGLVFAADTLITNDHRWDRLKAEAVKVLDLDEMLKN